MLDLRTVLPGEETALLEALDRACRGTVARQGTDVRRPGRRRALLFVSLLLPAAPLSAQEVVRRVGRDTVEAEAARPIRAA